MAPNDLMALNAHFSNWAKTRGLGLTGVAPFNYYVVENFLKAYPVGDKEIRTGIVDSPLDGGVDAFFFFANRKYVFDDPLDSQAEYRVNLAIFQCKEGTGFSPVETGKFVFFTEDLLDLGKDEKDYKSNYHDRLRTLMATFKEQMKVIIASISSLEIDYFYVSKLDIDEPKAGGDVANYAGRLKVKVAAYFPKAKCNVNFVNAAKLFAQASIRKTKAKQLSYSSQTIQSKEGWIGLVSLRSFFSFLKDEHGDFQESMLEENVRGFQQDTPVNRKIIETLREPDKSAEFWVLNNGITILAEELTPSGLQALNLKDPQIVNGLQTSRQVFDYYKSIGGGADADERRLLVRIVETKDESIRDQIIRATNSQNKMPPEALRATDPIHRKIEEVFGTLGLFYDRRKGHYKDLGKPVAKIVSVREVLQATLAIALRRPEEARGRPADYLKDDKKYAEIYESDKLQVTTYLRCIELVRRIEALKPADEYRKHAYNLLYYVALCVACRAIQNAHVPISLLNTLSVAKIDDHQIIAAYEEVLPIYVKSGGDDKAAKGNEFRDKLVAYLENSIHGK